MSNYHVEPAARPQALTKEAIKSLRKQQVQGLSRRQLLRFALGTGVGLWFRASGELPLNDVCEIHVELVLASLQASRELIDGAIEGLRAVPAGLPGDDLEAAA